MADSLAGTMRLVGGDPSLDFVNTVGGRRDGGDGPVIADKLGSYADLLAFARHAGLLTEPTRRRLAAAAERRPAEATRVLERAVALREALHRVLRAVMRGQPGGRADLALVDRELRQARSRERLVVADGGLRWSSPEGRGLAAVLEPVRRAAAGLVTSDHLSRLRQCSGEECGWLFLDRSRNHSRHWCTMQDCGNRSKVRRFRRRRGTPRARRS